MRPSECDGLAVARRRRHVSRSAWEGRVWLPQRRVAVVCSRSDGTLRESRGRATGGPWALEAEEDARRPVSRRRHPLAVVWPGNRRSGWVWCCCRMACTCTKNRGRTLQTRELGRRDRQSHGLGDHASQAGHRLSYCAYWKEVSTTDARRPCSPTSQSSLPRGLPDGILLEHHRAGFRTGSTRMADAGAPVLKCRCCRDAVFASQFPPAGPGKTSTSAATPPPTTTCSALRAIAPCFIATGAPTPY